MILVDTSVWADHLRRTEPGLVRLLTEGAVLIHPFVIEELACGPLPRREATLALLQALPKVRLAGHEEIIDFITSARLYGTGLGSVDVHLLASARLSGVRVWSKDAALCREAHRLSLFGGERHGARKKNGN